MFYIIYHFIPTLSNLDYLLLTESNRSLEVTVLAQGHRDKNYKGSIQIQVYLTQKTGLLTTMPGLHKNSRIILLDESMLFASGKMLPLSNILSGVLSLRLLALRERALSKHSEAQLLF